MAELDELELVIVGDEAETVFAQIAADLLGLGERGEAFARRFDFNRTAFGSLVRQWRGLPAIATGKRPPSGRPAPRLPGWATKTTRGLSVSPTALSKFESGV